MMSNDTYKQCVDMASWFIESQTKFLPLVLVPKNLYIKDLNDITAINEANCPLFKVQPYEGKYIITIPDEV
jgi:hypothetical protein